MYGAEMILGLKNIIIAGAVGLLIGSLSAGFYVRSVVNDKWNAKIAQQKIEAAAQLQKATIKVLETERKFAKLSTELEVQNEISKNRLEAVTDTNRRLAVANGGLRDPGRRAGCSCPLPGNAGATSSAQSQTTGAQLSTEATEFLLTLTKEADDAAVYAQTCHNWIEEINKFKH